MSTNPLIALKGHGQSIWLDYIRRGMLHDGELERLIRDDGLAGMTSNPTIFEKAIAHSSDYDDTIARLAGEGASAGEIYRRITHEDITRAADLFAGVYEASDRRDGFVSLEVSPHLARDTDATIGEGGQLWRALDRPNVMIKVPGTREGLPAIRRLIAAGVNVNVTLLFGLERYREAADAWMTGLEDRLDAGQPLGYVASVASFFLSRIDTLVDGRLEADGAAVRGRTAIACARSAYQIYKELITSDRWQRLAAEGAQPQRLLWASTSTKNADYPDCMYVDALIGPDTVNTVPPETLAAYRDHGNPAPRLDSELDEARAVLEALPGHGIDLDAVTDQLEAEGIEKFVQPFDQLMASIERRRLELAS